MPTIALDMTFMWKYCSVLWDDLIHVITLNNCDEKVIIQLISDTRVHVFNEKSLQLPALAQCGKMIENVEFIGIVWVR